MCQNGWLELLLTKELSIPGVASFFINHLLLVIVECQFKKAHILTQSSDTAVLKNSLLIDHLETAANANSCQL